MGQFRPVVPPGGAACKARDGGFTLLEVTISILILGIVMSSLALAFSVAMRTNPNNEARIDDSRSTRGLATWLSYDTSSAPPFVGETPQGGIVTSAVNDCAGPGTNLLQLKWIEKAATTSTHVASYRFRPGVDGTGEIVRVSCSRLGTAPYRPASVVLVTSNLAPASAPTVNLVVNTAGEVTKVSFTLIGRTGQSVLVETASRNPADFFP